MSVELKNKISKLFPELVNGGVQQYHVGDFDANTDGNGNALPYEKIDGGDKQTMNLLSSLSKNWIDKVSNENGILDEDMFITSEQVNMAAGNPVINVEVLNINDAAKIDGHDFEGGTGSKFFERVAQVRLKRYHFDFKLYDTDILYGYGMENKVKAAASNVLHTITQDYLNTVCGSRRHLGPKAMDINGVAELASCFKLADRLYLTPTVYAQFVGDCIGTLDLSNTGILGWEKIVRIGGSYTLNGNVAGFGVEKGDVVGATGYQSFEAISAYAGSAVAVRDLGTICGIPFVAIFSFDAATMAIRCSVQAWAGFTTTSSTPATSFDYKAVTKKVEVVNTTSAPVNTKEVTA